MRSELGLSLLSGRETALQHRWRMWSAGLTGPPNYVPKSWEGRPEADELLERARAVAGTTTKKEES